MSSVIRESEVAHPDPAAKLQDNVAPLAASHVAPAHQYQEDTAKEPVQERELEDDSDGYSNLSLYDEILNGDPEDVDFEEKQAQTCTADESRMLRKRLRDVGPQAFVEETLGSEKYSLSKLLAAFRVFVPSYLEREQLLELLGFAMYRELQLRQRLEQYSTIDDVVKLLLSSKNIMVITGAGISTSLGIPDFRSRDTGFYSKLRAMGLEDPESVFNLEEFDYDPSRFYSLAGDLIPDLNKWSPTHQFIKVLQDNNKLLRNYTQNIDNVESYAGIHSNKIVHCHGSWKTASCRKCKNQVPGAELFPYLRRQEVARCKVCDMTAPPTLKRKRSQQPGSTNAKARKRGASYDYDSDTDDDDDDADASGAYDIPEPGIMKPDITFFGESLPDTFYTTLNSTDRAAADLVLVLGTSMKVAPVSEIPQHLARHVPHVYISRDPCHHIAFDVTLLGDCDAVVAELCRRAGWPLLHPMLPKGAVYEVREAEGAAGEGVWRVAATAAAAAAGGAGTALPANAVANAATNQGAGVASPADGASSAAPSAAPT